MIFWHQVLAVLVALFFASHTLIEKTQAASQTEKLQAELVIYAADDFMASSGLGPAILPLFEKKQNCRIRVLPVGDGGQILTRLQIDSRRKKRVAHLVLGIDQNIWQRAKPWLDTWGVWKPQGYSKINPKVQIESGFLPYDYGVFAWMVDQNGLRKMGKKVPHSLLDLLKPEWKRNLLLQDPRTSMPGLAFLLYSKKILGEKVWDFWKSFRTQWLTLTPGWSEAYGLFLNQEAPLVWSYISSQAYHEEKGDFKNGVRRYQAILFEEGQPFQIEGAAWVKGALQTPAEKELARRFLEFLISPEIQKIIPLKNWMIPVLQKIEIPKSYQNLPQPFKMIPTVMSAQELDETLSRWEQTLM